MPLVVDFEKPFLISGSKELLSKEIVKQRFVDIPAGSYTVHLLKPNIGFMQLLQSPLTGSAWLYSQNGVNFHKTSCAKVYLFHISKNDWDNDLIQLTKLMMKAEALNRLRTNETLGYRVFTETYFLNKRTSCVSIAVDSLKDPYFVAERIHSFLRDFAVNFFTYNIIMNKLKCKYYRFLGKSKKYDGRALVHHDFDTPVLKLS